MGKTALIIGATGATGKCLTQMLIQSDYYTTVVVVHRNKTVFGAIPKVKEIVTNFYRLTESLSEITGIDDVFCCIGSTLKNAGSKSEFYKIDCEYVLTLGEWAKQTGVKSFHVISFFGADPKSMNYYNRTKGLMELGLRKMQLPRLAIYHPPLLSGREKPRSGEIAGFAFLKLMQPLLIGKLRKYRPLPVQKLAKAMFVCAQSQSKGEIVVGSVELQGF